MGCAHDASKNRPVAPAAPLYGRHRMLPSPAKRKAQSSFLSESRMPAACCEPSLPE